VLADFLRRNKLCGEGAATAIVASVPEPLESRLNDTSDQVLSALLLATERARGALVDAWLPWVRDRRTEQDVHGGLNFEYRSATEGYTLRAPPDLAECHETWPGAIVVAHDSKPDKRDASLLLVVGELPTAGIRETSFERAARIANHLNHVDPGRLQIVGPVFSGSAGPLRRSLLELIRKNVITSADIWTGSATNETNRELLSSKDKLSFHSTVAPDKPALQALYQFLTDQGFTEKAESGVMKHVALLTEADTAYGQLNSVDSQAPDAGAKESKPSGSQELIPRYRIWFPIHISDVRSAWEKETLSLRQTAPAARLQIPQQAVRVDLEERVTDARDDLPTFSSVSSAYDERALASALAMLRENSVDVVGIIATDTRDRLFLAEAVHRSAPDAQLFMLESDILFSHPDYSEALRGTLVASTYPLVTANQFWSGRVPPDKTQQRNQFGSSMAEGVYNATLFAFASFADGKDKLCREFQEYHWPLFGGLSNELLEAGKPPVWLTVVGSNAPWPVAALAIDDQKYMASLPPNCAQLPKERPAESNSSANVAVAGIALPSQGPSEPTRLQKPELEMLHTLTVIFVLFCLLVAGFAGCVAAAHAGFFGPDNAKILLRERSMLASLLVLDPGWGPGHKRRQRVGVVVSAVAMVVFIGLTVWLGSVAVASAEIRHKLNEASAPNSIDGWHAVRPLAASFAISMCVFALVRLIMHRWLVQRPRRLAGWVVPGTLAVVGCHLAPFFMHACAQAAFLDDKAIGISRYWRMIHPSSLVSPLAPVAGFLVIFLLTSSYVMRVIHLDERMAQPILKRDADADGGADFWDGFLMLRSPAHRAPALLIAVVMFGCGWTLWNVRAPLDFPAGWFWIMPVIAAIALFCCGLQVCHLAVMWRSMQGYLSSVDLRRLKPAFKSERREIASSLGRGSAMHEPATANIEHLNELFMGNEPNADERFQATRVAYLAAYGICRLRGLWFRLSMCTLVFVACIGFYPIHPHKEMLVLGWMLVGIVTGVTAWVFVEMNRNPVLSTLAGTKPNEVTWTADFVEKLLTVGGIPLVGIVAAAFPQVARFIGTILEPIFRGH
jgi:hypothetical protein